MVNIVVDGEGGDFAPNEVVKGVLEASDKAPFRILITGRESILKLYEKDINTIYCSDPAPTDESPTEAFRMKRNSSLFSALELLKEGKADAFITAGSTGNLLVGATMILGRMKNIERPALGVFLPTSTGKKNFFIDIGANPDIKPAHLRGLAILSQVFFQVSTGTNTPPIALLSNGIEEDKGNYFTREARKFLEDLPGFIGYAEGFDIFSEPSKILLTDGFTGNLIIKSLEGLGDFIKNGLFDIQKTYRGKIGLLLLKPNLKAILKSLDYSEYGGAPLLGINGICIKAHGRSKAKSISKAIWLAYKLIEKGYMQHVKNRLDFEESRSESI